MWVVSLNWFFLLVLLLQLSGLRGTRLSSRLSTIDTFPTSIRPGLSVKRRWIACQSPNKKDISTCIRLTAGFWNGSSGYLLLLLLSRRLFVQSLLICHPAVFRIISDASAPRRITLSLLNASGIWLGLQVISTGSSLSTEGGVKVLQYFRTYPSFFLISVYPLNSGISHAAKLLGSIGSTRNILH